MLIWGSKGAVADLGVQAHHHCATCERERPFKLALQYKIHHLYYLFKWVSSKQYLLVCEVCQRGSQLVAKDVESKLTKNPIPVMHRFGWVLLVALIGLVIVVGKFADDERGQRVSTLAAAPAVGDLYVVNLNKLTNESGTTYGVMRVLRVADGQVEFQLPRMGYNKLKGATRDAGDAAKLSGPGYFEDKTIVLPQSVIQTWSSQGSIHDIERR